MKYLHQFLIIFFFLTAFAITGNAQHQIYSTLNRNAFTKGDTINFEIGLNNDAPKIKTATIHLWIEEISTGRKWHYKYPLINGYLNARIVVDSSLAPGNYAFNFFMQKDFFRIKGEVKNAVKKDNLINYVLLSKNKDIVPGVLPLDTNKFFMSECLLFQDSAYIVFSRANHKGNNLEINLVNTLDSSFVSSDSITNFISIYDQKDTLQKNIELPKQYSFNTADRLYKTIMPEIIVKAKSKKLVDDYQKDNVSGMFGGTDGTVIDGLESDEIARSINLFTFLTSKVAGLSIKNSEDGEELMWRKHRTDIFIDEIKVDPELANNISLADIAMIKIFEPGVQVSFGSGAGGTIAIYLKIGIYKRENKPTNNFRIMGYTGLDVIWK